MSNRPLSLVSAGHPARARETNHSRGGAKSNRNGNSNRKQPRNWNARRGGGNNFPFPSAGKGRDLMADEPIANTNSKGTNLNHLLSFQSYESSTNQSGRNTRSQRLVQSRAAKGKEDYVQSTAQFVINENCELEITPFQSDPDLPVPWKFIQVIRLFGQEETECPICLHPPIAAKVGRCGHAHCSSCILKLISISEYPECPICQCDIKLSDLRSVICGVEKRPKLNSTVEFVKMKRTKNSVAAVPQAPVNSTWISRYDRVISVSAVSILENVLDREEAELACQSSECEESEVPFIDQAKDLLKSRQLALGAPTLSEEAKCTKPKVDIFQSENPNLDENVDQSEIGQPENVEKDDSYYFYQTVNCGNIFLSSLNAKCLITQFGSLKNAPTTISATMLEIDDYTMDQDVRRRFRYLNHLSLGEAFSLVYLDSDGLGLSKETFEKHKIQIQQRKKKLNQKDRAEKKAHKLVEEYYDRELYGKYKAAEISLSSQEMFPDFGESPSQESAPIPIQNQGTSGSWVKNTSSWSSSPMDWPVASPGTSANKSSPCGSSGSSFWGEMKKTSKTGNMETLKKVEETVSDDDLLELRAPDFRSEFAADLYSALEEATNDKKETSPTEKKPKKGQKKKKGRVIFST